MRRICLCAATLKSMLISDSQLYTQSQRAQTLCKLNYFPIPIPRGKIVRGISANLHFCARTVVLPQHYAIGHRLAAPRRPSSAAESRQPILSEVKKETTRQRAGPPRGPLTRPGSPAAQTPRAKYSKVEIGAHAH